MESIEISPEQLKQLTDGVRVLELVLRGENLPTAWVYALTTSQEVIFKAEDALREEGERDREDEMDQTFEAPKLTEIAIAIPVSGDGLYYLTGSGLKLTNEAFAYRKAGEGPMLTDFTWSRTPARLTVADLKLIELADSDIYLDDFLERNTAATAAAPEKKTVERDEEATKPKSTNPIDNYLAS
jgi:hypothetical protein